MPDKKAFVVGYYGCSNAGDECLFQQTVRILRANAVKEFRVLGTPLDRPHDLPVNVVHRYAFVQIVMAIFWCDVVVFGGGSLLQDQTSRRSLWYYLAILWLAHVLKKKTVLLGQGVGPLIRKSSQYLTASMLRRVQRTVCRDQTSYALVSDWIQRSSQCDLGSDLAFFRPRILADRFDPKGNIGVSLRPFPWVDRWISVVNTIVKPDQDLIFLAFQQGVDTKVWHQWAIDADSYPTWDMTKVMVGRANYPEKFRYVLGMRYHACVWACLQGLPFFAMAYDPKVVEIANECGQPYIDLRQPVGKPQLENQWHSFCRKLSDYQQRCLEQRHALIARASVYDRLVVSG